MTTQNTTEQNIEAKEKDFHDQWADEQINETLYYKETFESHSCPEGQQIKKWMGDINGKKILELGCGLGEASIYFASLGAQVLSTDISPKMLENVKKKSDQLGLKLETLHVSANSLDNISNESFDYTYAGNLLHHVNIQNCIDELYKKLKPGGKAFFWDPIAYNPAINIYRKKATQVRTEDEHPLTLSDLKLIEGKFSKVEFKFFWLTGLFVFLKYYFIDRHNPNKVRYWKKILEEADRLHPALKFCHALDQFLFKFIPGLKYWAWNVAIHATK